MKGRPAMPAGRHRAAGRRPERSNGQQAPGFSAQKLS